MDSQDTKVEVHENPILYYKNKEWVIYNEETKDINLNSLKILTFNVWFSQYYLKERAEELMKQIKKLKVDIVCLQEVTKSFIDVFAKSKLKKKYYVSQYSNVQAKSGYGVLIISKFPPRNIKLYPMESRMGRCVMVAEFLINGETLCISTVHLESLNNWNRRKKQLTFIKSILKDYENSLLMGDFNFDSEKSYLPGAPLENVNLKEIYPEYIDVWENLNPDDPGKTFDTTKNDMLCDMKHEVMRYDRIIMKSDRWEPKEIKMIGTEPFMLSNKKKGVHISDHFGLFLKIEIK